MFMFKYIRLGRVSFRAIKAKRDYLQKRKSASWIYMSRLAAMKEYAFMKVSFFRETTFVYFILICLSIKIYNRFYIIMDFLYRNQLTKLDIVL